MSRLPSLGPRGVGWIVIQGILIVLVAVSGWKLRAGWPDQLRLVGVLFGAALIFCGLALVVRARFDLGTAWTPLPQPRDGARLVDTGAFKIVRHPIYTGLILAALGWGIAMASPAAIVLTVLLTGFSYLKSAREETLLEARYPGYAAYRARTPRFIPWIGR